MTDQAKFLSYVLDLTSVADTAVETFDISIKAAELNGHDYITMPVEAAASVSLVLSVLALMTKRLTLENADIEDSVTNLVSKLTRGPGA